MKQILLSLLLITLVKHSTAETVVVANLGELRAAYDSNSTDIVYTVSGRVYVSAVYNENYLFIQDNTSAIQIYDGNDLLTTLHSIGDGIINLTGTLTEYNGVIELVPTDDLDDYTTGNTVSATTVTIRELENNWETYESRLITIDNVSFDASVVGTSFSYYTGYTITDKDNNQYNLFSKFSDLYTATVPAQANVTGVATLYQASTFQICPRQASDIVTITTTSIDKVNVESSIYPNPFSDVITIENQNIKAIQLLNITGEVVKIISAVETEKIIVSTSDISNGIYILKIINEDGSSFLKKVIKN